MEWRIWSFYLQSFVQSMPENDNQWIHSCCLTAPQTDVWPSAWVTVSIWSWFTHTWVPSVFSDFNSPSKNILLMHDALWWIGLPALVKFWFTVTLTTRKGWLPLFLLFSPSYTLLYWFIRGLSFLGSLLWGKMLLLALSWYQVFKTSPKRQLKNLSRILFLSKRKLEVTFKDTT